MPNSYKTCCKLMITFDMAVSPFSLISLSQSGFSPPGLQALWQQMECSKKAFLWGRQHRPEVALKRRGTTIKLLVSEYICSTNTHCLIVVGKFFILKHYSSKKFSYFSKICLWREKRITVVMRGTVCVCVYKSVNKTWRVNPPIFPHPQFCTI